MLLSIKFVVLVLIVCADGKGTTRELPPYIKRCSRSDPHISTCIKDVIESLKPMLANGIPEIYIPSFDPLHLPKAVLKENALEASFDDIKVKHLNKNQIIDLHLDLEKNEFGFHLQIPSIQIESMYKVKGKILILALNGQGASHGNYTDVSAKILMKGNRVFKNSAEFIRFDQAKVKIAIKDAQIYSEGLIQDPEMNDAVNKIINANIKDFLEELMPVVDATVEKFVLQITKKFFASFSLDCLFVP